ncbi:MAG: sensor domain-containing protein [Mycobacterium sp.]
MTTNLPPAIRVLVALALGVATLGGCAHLIDGHAVYATETPSANPRSVKIADLPKLIPTLAEIGAVIDSAPLTKTATLTKVATVPLGYRISEPKCISVISPALEPSYRGSHYQSAYGLAANDRQYRVVDADAVAFPSAVESQKFVQNQAGRWKDCTDKTLTVNMQGTPPVNWIVSAPTRSGNVDVVLRIQQGGQGYACARGVAARANIVADVSICSPDQTLIKAQAGTLVNTILGKIPA